MDCDNITSRISDGTSLPVAESFYSIQGEGFNTGKAAWFIRLGGCDVRCPWCDSPSTWNPERHPVMTVEKITEEIAASPAANIVITGGEPLMHPLGPLCAALRKKGYSIFLETSGTSPLSGDFDWICLSPKRHRPPLAGNPGRADEIKAVVSSMEDILWAETVVKSAKAECVLSLQPEWGHRESVTPIIIEYVKQHPRWRISLQTHKYIGIP